MDLPLMENTWNITSMLLVRQSFGPYTSSQHSLASFPGSKRNGLATSASSNCIQMWCDIMAIAICIPTV